MKGYLFTTPKWEHGYPVDYDGTWQNGLLMGKGDETVPLKSARDLGLPYFSAQEKHRDMPTFRQQDVIYALTGKRSAEFVMLELYNHKITLDSFLLVNLRSPIDVLVTAPDGQRIGKDFPNNTIINEINGAYYPGFDGPLEFVFIPNPLPGKYEITVQGTDNGAYGLDLTFIDEVQEKTISLDNQINQGEIIKYASNLDLENLNEWQIGPADDIPPLITIIPQQSQFLKSEKIDITIEDKESDLLKEYTISLDGVKLASGLDTVGLVSYPISLSDLPFGPHSLDITAQDQTGNNAGAAFNFELYSTIGETIKDAEGIWYQHAIIKRAILKQLNQLQIEFQDLAKNPNNGKIKARVRIRINAILLELKVLRNKNLIKPDGYQILTEDLKYLLSKL